MSRKDNISHRTLAPSRRRSRRTNPTYLLPRGHLLSVTSVDVGSGGWGGETMTVGAGGNGGVNNTRGVEDAGGGVE